MIPPRRDPANFGRYVLDDLGQASYEPDLIRWTRFMTQPGARNVANTVTPAGEVSTVFLGLDHRFTLYSTHDAPSPILWETLIFGGPHDGWCDRYSSLQQAQAGHAAAVRWLLGEGPEPE